MSILGGQLLLLQAVANTETTAHCGHLVVELLPCDFVVKAQPAELDLHTEKEKDTCKKKSPSQLENCDIEETCNVTFMMLHLPLMLKRTWLPVEVILQVLQESVSFAEHTGQICAFNEHRFTTGMSSVEQYDFNPAALQCTLLHILHKCQ